MISEVFGPSAELRPRDWLIATLGCPDLVGREENLRRGAVFGLCIPAHLVVEEPYRAGCALPFGHIEEYAKLNLTGWSWGIVELGIWDQHIQESQFISMDRLEKQYGSKAQSLDRKKEKTI